LQLHELAGIVFVETEIALLPSEVGAFGEAGAGADAGGVVKIIEHGRAHGGGDEEVFEVAESAGADDVSLVSGYVIGRILGLLRVDIEVVEPEVGHDLVELALTIKINDRWNGMRARRLICGLGLG
jgi:hypothetical protein